MKQNRLFLYFLLVVSSILSQHPCAEETSPWRFWNTQNGLKESDSRFVTFSPLRHLYMSHGNVSQNSWFDGYKMHYSPKPTSGYVPIYENNYGQQITFLFGDGFINGFRRLEENQWTNYPVAAIQPEIDSILQLQDKYELTSFDRKIPIIPVGKNRLIFVLPSRLMMYDFNSRLATPIKNVEETNLGFFLDITQAKHGGMWIAGLRGLAHIEDALGNIDSQSHLKENLFDPDQFKSFSNPIEVKEDEVFGITYSLEHGKRILVAFDGETWDTMYIPDVDLIMSGWRGVGNTYWVLLRDRLLHVYSNERSNEKVVKEIDKSGVLSGAFTGAAVDNRQAFWVSTIQGLARHANPIFQIPFQLKDQTEIIHSIISDDHDRLWFASRFFLMKHENGEWTTYPFRNVFPDTTIQSRLFQTNALSVLDDGRIMISTYHKDFFLIFDPSTNSFDKMIPPAGYKVGMITPAEKRNTWVELTPLENAATKAIHLFDGNSFQLVTDEWDYNLGGAVRYIFQDSQKRLWLGGTGNKKGIALYENGQLTHFGPEEGYNDEGGFSIAEIDPGVIWVGGRKTIHEYKNGEWSEISTPIENMGIVRSMIKINDGSIWIASGSGLHRYKNGHWISNTQEDNLPDTFVYEVFQDNQNTLWVGTAKGTCFFQPNADTEPPETWIPEETNWSEVPPNNKQIRFEVDGYDKWNYTLKNRLLYTYRLDKGEWSDLISENVITLTTVPKGDHTLEVRAVDRNFNYDQTPAVWSFKVLTLWYENPIVLFLAFVASCLIIFFASLAIYRHIQLAQSNRKLYEANEELKELDRMKTAFVSNASHDLRTPLTAIKGSLDNLGRGIAGELNDKQIHIVNRAVRAVNRLSDLVNDILDLSRIESGRVVLNRSHFFINSLVTTIIEEEKPVADQKNITLNYHANDEYINIVGDYGKLQRIIGELISNAIKYTPANGEVRVSINSSNNSVHLEVSDSGIGMSEEEKNKIWDRFYRTDTSIQFAKGTGLGLSIAKELVDMHGGIIVVESQPGKGSTFKMTLPLS